MDTPMRVLELNPTALPIGAQVGTWRVLGFRGRGTYGTVYTVQSQAPVRSGPAALKLAMWQYIQRAGLDATSPLMARPSDDVFALGVTAYRLVTDTYPPFTHPYTEEGQRWLTGDRGVPAPRQLNPRVDAQLNALILRMLSPRLEERGTAGELAEALERGVAHGGPAADTPLFEWETQPSSECTEEDHAQAVELGHRPRRRSRERVHASEQEDASARAEVTHREARARARKAALTMQGKARRWMPWLAAMMALGLWPEETGSQRTEGPVTAAEGGSAAQRNAVSLGDTSRKSSEAPKKAPGKEGVAQALPSQPLPGQLKVDSKGRCITRQVAINGGCWVKVDFPADECPGTGYVYRGGCYVPIFVSERQPTSAPGQSEP